MSAPILVTKADLSREFNVDPRRKAFNGLEPVAQARIAGNKLVPIYNREEAKRIFTEALLEATAKYSKEPNHNEISK
jgi:hypothetical protein